MYLTASGFMALRARISLPLTGTWTADVSLDPASSGSALPVQGAGLTISLGEGGFTLQGYCRRVNNAFGTVYARVIGGAGGLPETIDAKAYQGATFGIILQDILGQVGESLSATTPSAITNTTVPFWTTIQGPCWRTLAALVDEARTITGTLVNWRVLPDGTIYLGPETWAAASMTTFDLLSWSPQELEASFYAPNPTLLPGQTWQQGQVSNVEHVVDPVKVRSRVWFLDPS